MAPNLRVLQRGQTASLASCFFLKLCRDQFAVWQRLPLPNSPQCFLEHARSLAPIEPVFKFSKIAVQVLYRNLVKAAHDAALEQREGRLNGVGVDFTAHILPTVVNRVVLWQLILAQPEGIDRGLVGHDALDIGRDVCLYQWSDGLRFRTALANVPVAKLAAALNHAHHCVFVLVLAFAAIAAAYRLAADVGLINLDRGGWPTRIDMANELSRLAPQGWKPILLSSAGLTNGGVSVCMVLEHQLGT